MPPAEPGDVQRTEDVGICVLCAPNACGAVGDSAVAACGAAPGGMLSAGDEPADESPRPPGFSWYGNASVLTRLSTCAFLRFCSIGGSAANSSE